MKYKGKVEQGKLIIDPLSGYYTHLSTLNGKAVTVSVEPFKTHRTSNQNRYYWAVVIGILSDYTGYTPDEMHDALKFKFLRKDLKGLQGCGQTSELNTGEMEEYLSKVRQWASIDLGVYIPLPNEAEQ